MLELQVFGGGGKDLNFQWSANVDVFLDIALPILMLHMNQINSLDISLYTSTREAHPYWLPDFDMAWMVQKYKMRLDLV